MAHTVCSERVPGGTRAPPRGSKRPQLATVARQRAQGHSAAPRRKLGRKKAPASRPRCGQQAEVAGGEYLCRPATGRRIPAPIGSPVCGPASSWRSASSGCQASAAKCSSLGPSQRERAGRPMGAVYLVVRQRNEFAARIPVAQADRMRAPNNAPQVASEPPPLSRWWWTEQPGSPHTKGQPSKGALLRATRLKPQASSLERPEGPSSGAFRPLSPVGRSSNWKASVIICIVNPFKWQIRRPKPHCARPRERHLASSLAERGKRGAPCTGRAQSAPTLRAAPMRAHQRRRPIPPP